MPTEQEIFSTRFNRRTLQRGFILFCILTMAGLVFNFVRGENRNVFTLVRAMHWPYLVVIVSAIALDWFLMGYRLYIFGKPVAPHTTFRDYVRAGLANIFAAGLTPSSTGGGPAQIYILQRAGVPMSGCLALSVINLFSTLLFFFCGAWMALAIDPALYTGDLHRLMQYGFVAFSVSLLLLAGAILKPEWSLRMLGGAVHAVRLVSKRAGALLARIVRKLDTIMYEYKSHLVYFILKRPGLVLKSLLGTVALYFNRFLIAYFIVRLLGQGVPFWHLLFVQVVQYYIIYFAITPGSGGIAEISASALMAALIPKQETAYFALLWRMSTLYLPFIAGAVIVLHQLGSELGQTSLGKHSGEEDARLAR